MKQGLHQLILKVYELSVSQVDNNTVQLIHAKWMNLGKFCVALCGILFVLYVEPNRTETFIVTDRMNSSISFTLVFFFSFFSLTHSLLRITSFSFFYTAMNVMYGKLKMVHTKRKNIWLRVTNVPKDDKLSYVSTVSKSNQKSIDD